jgi:hypothetical protein
VDLPVLTGVANVSLAALDAIDHSVIATLGTSAPLNSYSFDAFKGYSGGDFSSVNSLSHRVTYKWAVRMRLDALYYLCSKLGSKLIF